MSVRAVLFIVLVLNWVVAGFKLAAGMAIQSLALQADAYHSFLDGCSNIVGMISLAMASAPADEDHPYGHEKFETLATLGVTFLIFLTSFEVLQDSVARLRAPVPLTGEVGIGAAVVVVTLVINVFIVWWERRQGALLRSEFLLADATHTFSDILVTLGVLGSLLAAKAGYRDLDPWIALLIGIFIAHIGYQLLQRAAPILVDAEAIPASEIEAVILTVEGITSCHKIRSRGRELQVFIDLHIQVDPQMPVHHAHALSHIAKDRVMQRWAGVRDVTIHIEPLE